MSMTGKKYYILYYTSYAPVSTPLPINICFTPIHVQYPDSYRNLL